MIVHLPSTLARDAFLERHPIPHVIVGQLDQMEPARGEFLSDQPAYFSSLTWVLAALGLAGDCTARVLEDWSTVWLAFAREEDALRVCALVNALPEMQVAGECASAATFVFDTLLHERLRAIRDHRIAEIEAAQLRGEEVAYLLADGTLLDSDAGPANCIAEAWQ